MIFANPQFLTALSLIPAAILLLIWAGRRRNRALNRLGDPSLIERLSVSINRRGRRWRNVAQLSALALLIIALARPQWGSEVREIEQEGLQLVVALDVSQSMMAQDIKPSRLDRAKLEIADLTERLDGDEIALVLFSGASFVQVPLTSDYLTALNYLDSAGPSSISRPGTVIGDAIQTARGAFDPELSSQKVLVLMTDGEDKETDPLAVAKEAAGEDILIYTIGFGTPEGEPVPELSPTGEVIGYKQDQQGEIVLSRLDESTLQEIAEIGGGKYYRASADGRELDQLLGEIDSLQQAQLQSRFEVQHIERFQIFLGLAITALVLGELIPDRRTPRAKARASRRTWPWTRRQPQLEGIV